MHIAALINRAARRVLDEVPIIYYDFIVMYLCCLRAESRRDYPGSGQKKLCRNQHIDDGYGGLPEYTQYKKCP